MASFSQKQLDEVFHAYDIRGLDPQQLNEEFFESLGKAYVTFLNAKKIAVGNDIRKTGPKYKQAFIKGATSLGCDVVDIGEIATEMLYFKVGSDKSFDGGATVTASHNPSGWNGCKMVAKEAFPLSGDYGLNDIKSLMIENSFKPSARIGNVTTEDIYPAFKTKILSLLKDTKLKHLKIVVDAGNGIGGNIFDYVFGDLGFDLTKMYFEPDDRFPNHIPNPMEVENVKDIMAKTVELKADIGIAIDGDADRVFFIDNKGRNPDGIYTGAIFTEYFLSKYPGSTIIQDPRVIWPVTDAVSKLKGKSIFCKAGHSFFKEKMKTNDAVYGAENSSHFYYKDFYYADSGMITIALMLKLLSEGLDFDEKLDEIYDTYPKSGEVNYTVSDAKGLISQVESYYRQKYSDAKFDYIDGITVEGKDWRFNLRSSNTQPLIRLNLEARNKQTVIDKFKEVEKLIDSKRETQPLMPELV